MADQRKTQAASFRVVHQRISGAIELLEDFRLLSPRDADAVIRHLEFHRAVGAVELHAQELFVSRVFQRVVNQVDQRPRDCFAIHAHGRDVWVNTRGQRETLLLDLIAIRIKRVRNQLCNISLTEFIFFVAGFNAREIEDVIDKRREPFALFANDAVILLLLLRR